jgi:hypothetical protein
MVWRVGGHFRVFAHCGGGGGECSEGECD